jgi:hypothetical protein
MCILVTQKEQPTIETIKVTTFREAKSFLFHDDIVHYADLPTVHSVFMLSYVFIIKNSFVHSDFIITAAPKVIHNRKRTKTKPQTTEDEAII